MDESAAVSELGVDFQRDVRTADMSVGDVLLFNNLIPHRWAQLQWNLQPVLNSTCQQTLTLIVLMKNQV